MVRNYLCSKVSSLKPDIGQFTLSAEVVQKLCAADNGFGLCYPTDQLSNRIPNVLTVKARNLGKSFTCSPLRISRKFTQQ